MNDVVSMDCKGMVKKNYKSEVCAADTYDIADQPLYLSASIPVRLLSA